MCVEAVGLSILGVLILLATRNPLPRVDEKAPNEHLRWGGDDPCKLKVAEWRVEQEAQKQLDAHHKAMEHGHDFDPRDPICWKCGMSKLEYHDERQPEWCVITPVDAPYTLLDIRCNYLKRLRASNSLTQ